MIYTFKPITDGQNWDTFVENFKVNSDDIPTTTFIQSSSWKTFQESLGRETYPIGIFAGSILVGVALGIVINAKRGKYLYIRNGPIINWEDRNLVQQLISHLKNWGKEKGLWFIRISPLIEQGSLGHNILSEFNFPRFAMNEVEALDTWIMDIRKDEDELFASIDKKTRYLIRKAEKDGVTVEVYDNSKKFEYFYKIYEDTFKRQKWNAYSKQYIKNEFDAFAKDKRASLVLLKYNKRYISGGIFIHYADQTFYHYGGNLTDYAKIPSSYLMIWEAIKEAKSRGNSIFNFWGISPENHKNHPWEGLTKFKKKFPGKEQRWAPALDIPISSKYYLTNLYDKLDRIKKGY